MSRSIHTTRRDLAEELLWDPHGERAERMRAELRRKRSIKRSVLQERHTPPRPGVSPGESIPVVERDAAPHIVYGASEADIRAVMERLPRATTDGLSGIELTLARDEEVEDGDPDPYTGRRSVEPVPGMWRTFLAGRHYEGRIQLVGSVVEPEHPLRDLIATNLRLHALATLVHELAHYVDHMTRVSRGRWRADERRKLEDYADERQLAWPREVVIPYLEERYPDDVEALLGWIERNGGVRVSLATIAGDPTNPHEMVWTFRTGLDELMKCVLEGMNPVDARAEFGRELWVCDLHDELSVVVQGILAERPGHHGALLLQAELLDVRDRVDEAEALIRTVLAQDPASERAWMQLTQIQSAR